MTLTGANADELALAARRLRQGAEDLDGYSVGLGRTLDSVRWLGGVADVFATLWAGQRRLQGSTADFLRNLAQHLDAQAEQQRAASGASTGDIRLSPVTLSGRLTREPPAWNELAPWQQSRRREFDTRDGRSALIEAFYATADEGRAAKDEIEIVRLSNGKWIVVLPGVVDLSAGLEGAKDAAIRQGALTAIAGGPMQAPLAGLAAGLGSAFGEYVGRNDFDSVRDMRYAMELAIRGGAYDNPYSAVVKEQMRLAGIPPGADVAIVGHSYGAYTAMDLAADTSFNRSGGDGDGYHVNVTHVVAAGAETDWRLREVPAGTDALVLNNSGDAAYRTEDVLHGDAGAVRSNQLEVEFNGGSEGVGHHPNNYADYLKSSTDPALARWLEGFGDYSGSGSYAPVKVHDPNR